jgi:hypothetical protein
MQYDLTSPTLDPVRDMGFILAPDDPWMLKVGLIRSLLLSDKERKFLISNLRDDLRGFRTGMYTPLWLAKSQPAFAEMTEEQKRFLVDEVMSLTY